MSIDDVGAPLDALTVVQCVTPPFLPANAEVMTVTVDYPPGCPGIAPHRHGRPVFGYVLEGEMLFELEGEAPRVIKAGEAFWELGETSSTTPTPTTAPTRRCASWRR